MILALTDIGHLEVADLIAIDDDGQTSDDVIGDEPLIIDRFRDAYDAAFGGAINLKFEWIKDALGLMIWKIC